MRFPPDPTKASPSASIAPVLAVLLCGLLACAATNSHAQEQADPSTLKRLSIEELMNVKITSVSRRPEKIGTTASAIQVITHEDIARSGATNLAEALRLASNLQVAQLSAQHWIISSRGFNSVYSNKLLVMIDGRTVYSPLFAGVFWDAQSVLLEDVERIEIISGPGGTMWGANAVNGVINIVTKAATETRGAYAAVGTGTNVRNLAEGRFGGTLGDGGAYRVYAQHHNREPTRLPDATENADAWDFTQAGFRTDWSSGQEQTYMVQGNFYHGIRTTSPRETTIDGQNILARWQSAFSEQSHLSIQTYADRTWRDDVTSAIKDELFTWDLDIQHNIEAGMHQVVWGVGYRFMRDKTINTTDAVGFIPRDRNMNLFSLFIQDELSIADGLRAVVGTKVQHNAFSGWDLQPGIRFAWSAHDGGLVWAAASRAVRAPSRIDVDYHIPAYHVPPTQPSVDGGPHFVSEKLDAYELGYRFQPAAAARFSVAMFYHAYDDLYSVEQVPNTLTYQIMNGAAGTAHGIEFAANVSVSELWRVRGGYTWFDKTLENKPGNVTDESALANLGSDASNIFILQSILDLGESFEIDLTARFVDQLPATQFIPSVAGYFGLNARAAWEFGDFELAFVGQNLLHAYHTEFAGVQIPRNIYGTIAWRP